MHQGATTRLGGMTKMKHSWQLDSDGLPDTWVLDYEYCNGPFCKVCFDAFCVNCHPNWAELECEGDGEEG
jgi:hypothetical protein